MPEDNGNTGESQAAIEAQMKELQDKLEKAEKQVNDKQDFINRQSNEIGKVRQQEQEIATLKESIAAFSEKFESLSKKLEGVNLEAKPAETKQVQTSPDTSGTTPDPKVNAVKVLADTYNKLNEEQREKVNEYVQGLPDEAKALLSDPEAKVQALTSAISELKLDIASPQKPRGFWDGIAPAPRELSPAEKLKSIIEGSTDKGKPTVPRSAFSSQTATRAQQESKQTTNEREGASPPPMRGGLLDNLKSQK